MINPEKKPATENPWYVLATLIIESDKIVVSEARRYWNAWASQEMTKEEKAAIKNREGKSILSDAPEWEFVREEVERLFKQRLPKTKLPRPTEKVDFSGFEFSNDIRFTGFFFPAIIYFDSAKFSGMASFEDTTFSGRASFMDATFSDAHFSSATFSGEAFFMNATFSGMASFEDTTFSGDAYFMNATFSGEANFGRATFSGMARFEETTFSGNASFMDATFSRTAIFEETTFSGNAYFSIATFSREAHFMNATFSGMAMFEKTTFSGDAHFSSARESFSGDAHFSSARFSSEAHFTSATFSREAHFMNATFSGAASFNDATFSGMARFEKTTFSGYAHFISATFSGPSKFISTKFSKAANFSDVVFDAPCDLGDAEFVIAYPNLSGTLLHSKTNVTAENKYWPNARIEQSNNDDNYVSESCAHLRQNMASQGLTEAAHFFFRREMDHKAKLSRWWERPFYEVYRWAEYGHGVWQPLVGIFLLWLSGALSLIYWGSLHWTTALGLAAANIFKFFGFQRVYFEDDVIGKLNPYLQSMTAAQTVIGYFLLFLLGLGLRNRFRLK